MEEDIKILKDLKNKWELNAFGDMVNSLSLNEIRAIENILNRLEQDERVIEEAIEFIENKVEYLKKCRTFKVVFYDEENMQHKWDETLLYKESDLLNILKGNQKEV